MPDDPFYAPNAKPLPPRVARPGEPLFSFAREHDRFACELRYHGEWGVEAQFLKNEELLIGRRFDTRELAVSWAEATRRTIEKVGRRRERVFKRLPARRHVGTTHVTNAGTPAAVVETDQEPLALDIDDWNGSSNVQRG